jgi:hypothetical protein
MLEIASSHFISILVYFALDEIFRPKPRELLDEVALQILEETS